MAAPIQHDNVRIRIRFPTSTEPKQHNAFNVLQRWILIDFLECPTIEDVECKIIANLSREIECRNKGSSVTDRNTKLENSPSSNKLTVNSEKLHNKHIGKDESRSYIPPKLSSSCDIDLDLDQGLWLNGFWLPSYESSRILRDGDEITVKKRHNTVIWMSDLKQGNKRKKRNENDPLSGEEEQSQETPSRSKKQKLLPETEKSHTVASLRGDSSSSDVHRHLKDPEKCEKIINPNLGEEIVNEAVVVDNNTEEGNESTKKKHKKKKRDRKASESWEGVHDGNSSVLSLSKVETGKASQISDPCQKPPEPLCTVEPSDVWSNEGRQYLQSLINTRIGELTAQTTTSCSLGSAATNTVRENGKISCKSNSKLFCNDGTNAAKHNVPSSQTGSSKSSKCPVESGKKVSDKMYHDRLSCLPEQGDLDDHRASDALPHENTAQISTPVHAQSTDGFETPHSNGIVAKRKRRRKRKKTSEKEMTSQHVSLAERSPQVNRDYSLRLPQHLQPRSGNRVLFDDDDDDDGTRQCLDTIAESENSMKTTLEGYSSDLFSGSEYNSSTVLLSNQNKLTSSTRVDQNQPEKAGFVEKKKHTNSNINDDRMLGILNRQRDSKKKDVFSQALSSDETCDSHNVSTRLDTAKPKLMNVVSADDKFASLLRNTRRLPDSSQISHLLEPKQRALSPHKKDAFVDKNRWRNPNTEMNRPDTKTSSTAAQQLNVQGEVRNPVPTGKVQISLLPLNTNQISTINPSGPPTKSRAVEQLQEKDKILPSVATDKVQPTSPSMCPREVATSIQSTLPSKQDFEEGLVPWPKIVWPSLAEPEKLPELKECPQPGDIIIYKTLELSEDYTPGLSDYKQALVLEVNTASGHLELLMAHAEKKRQGRFELELDEESENELDDLDRRRYLATVSRPDMVDAKLVSKA